MKEKPKIEVARVVLKVGGKELSLTLAEAMELSDVLEKAFGKSHLTYIYPYQQRTYLGSNASDTVSIGESASITLTS